MGQISKNFQVYFVHINFLINRRKKIYNRAEELYCDATIFVFQLFVIYLPEKKRNWKMAQACRLSPTVYLMYYIFICATFCLKHGNYASCLTQLNSFIYAYLCAQ